MVQKSVLIALMIISATIAMPLTELSDATVHVESLDEDAYQTLFVKWMQQHKKQYEHDEFYARYETFKTNLDWVRTKNAQGHDGFALNHLADMTKEEFEAKMLGTKISANNLPAAPATHEPTGTTLPQSVDWRQKGVVTPVKNQGQCGSCWSFSTTGSTEGAHAIATGNLVSLSEQNLMDCSTSYGNQGCNGGLMNQAFEYIIANNGIDTEASYPYEGQDDQCRFKQSNVGATISSFRNVTSGSESSLQDAVATAGPVSVAIDANHNEFMFYQSGVLVVPGCSSTQLDHGVLVVGYGTSAGKDYWIVKNSWGTSWGMEGYVWMARNHNNMCGIATSASYPIV